MKALFGFAIVAAMVSVGCSNAPTYTTVKTGPDRYMVSGQDPARVQGNAYKACQDAGEDYVDYEVLSHDSRGLQVRCVKAPKTFSQQASEAWDNVKKKVDDFRKSE
jgi:hypothetical protein